MSSYSGSPVIYLYNNKPVNVDGLIPSWRTFETDQQNEIYEYELLADGNDNLEVRDLDELLNMGTYKCYICNIEVPKSYSEEHKRSIKHLASLKITNLALERTSLHIKSDPIETIVKIAVADTYYCESCASVIRNTSRTNHDLSERHINYVKYDKLLQKLADMYGNSKIDNVLFGGLDCIDFDVNTENGETTVRELSETNKSCNTHNANLNKKKDNNREDNQKPLSKENETSLGNVTGLKNGFSNEMQNPKNKKAKRKLAKKSVQCTPHESSGKELVKVAEQGTPFERNIEPIKNNDTKEYEELKTYLEIASKKHKLACLVVALSKSTVKITANNGDAVNIPVLNFQGFIITEKQCLCTLCQKILEVDDKSHMSTEQHVKTIMASIKDKHCLRKVSDSGIHCLLCNSLHKLTEQDEHIKTVSHLGNLKKYSIDVKNNASGVIGHGTTSVRSSNRNFGNISNFLTKHNLQLTDDAAIFCNNCQIQIKNDRQVIFQHAYSAHHRQCNINSLVAENDLVLLKNGQYRCKPCGKDIYPYYLKTHCSYKQHKKKLNDKKKIVID